MCSLSLLVIRIREIKQVFILDIIRAVDLVGLQSHPQPPPVLHRTDLILLFVLYSC